jgi:hypothetical protein
MIVTCPVAAWTGPAQSVMNTISPPISLTEVIGMLTPPTIAVPILAVTARTPRSSSS